MSFVDSFGARVVCSLHTGQSRVIRACPLLAAYNHLLKGYHSFVSGIRLLCDLKYGMVDMLIEISSLFSCKRKNNCVSMH